ncbi:vanadium-dependent haloperoxidase [Frigidibacter oleivorans]|uniref:vanadium-dependent haloperoxidase n=1 Tax=Frigidibacter oleivorans TaxID=2487129 RepID=UPI000F8F65ED|nr:vanadium-dependent haloperoxidase [Frigidibacter oleivorans]
MLVLPKVSEPDGLNAIPVLYWNHAGLELNRITHSLGGPQTGPTMSSRALGLLHLAMHDAFFIVLGKPAASDPDPWLRPADWPRPADVGLPAPVPAALRTLANANIALTGAAVTVLDHLYGGGGAGISVLARDTLTSALSRLIADHAPHIDTLLPAYRYGVAVARVILGKLAVAPGEIGADAGRYEPRSGPFYFRDEPLNPVRLAPVDPDDPARGQRARRIYHGPYYGQTVRDFAVTDPDGHRIADWPKGAAYDAAVAEVVAVGGAAGRATTTRTPDQTVAALYWAYDGANLIGTPPRLYNQILRVIAWDKAAGMAAMDQHIELVRVFALANVAMADAGKYAWREKYRFELWRPLSGVREHHTIGEPAAGHAAMPAMADPFWLPLGAPETNTNKLSFKPPFPAYPSGHATFGAACFHIARLYYRDKGKASFAGEVDDIAFSFVSEELNGISRDLHQPHDPGQPLEDQPGLVRTLVNRHFPSLWQAIYENAISRIYLGVHWSFDAFAPADVAPGAGAPPAAYSNVWTAPRPAGVTDADLPIGGVPLGLGIANDIYGSGMQDPDQGGVAANLVDRLQARGVKISNTQIR